MYKYILKSSVEWTQNERNIQALKERKWTQHLIDTQLYEHIITKSDH